MREPTKFEIIEELTKRKSEEDLSVKRRLSNLTDEQLIEELEKVSK